MRLFVTILFTIVSVTTAQQQQLDPAYLRQYYSQLAQQGQSPQQGRAAAPIFEQQEPQQFAPQPARNYPRPAPQPAQTQIFVPAEQQARQYQPQPQQIQYQQPKAQPRPKKPVYNLQQEEENPEEEYDSNPSYQFGFDVKDDEFTNYQNRKETRDGNVIKGSYSVVDSDGFIRTVSYTADPKEGFKAEVVREPTDIVIKIPTPAPQTQQPQQIFRQAQLKAAPQQQQYVQQPQQARPQQQYRPEYYQQ
ncbi:hypothetical protein PVAND_008159 [Polypedilum vanderplanki]|uniref:Cuticle protein n=1 Tax=Polypedilum vanderplanki TaxID=319348 RepID=A0A9J6C9Q0_POLVA|nr:hypothetical protein PVAND_008159 [Polypedilum vanderplanki]